MPHAATGTVSSARGYRSVGSSSPAASMRSDVHLITPHSSSTQTSNPIRHSLARRYFFKRLRVMNEAWPSSTGGHTCCSRTSPVRRQPASELPPPAINAGRHIQLPLPMRLGQGDDPAYSATVGCSPSYVRRSSVFGALGNATKPPYRSHRPRLPPQHARLCGTARARQEQDPDSSGVVLVVKCRAKAGEGDGDGLALGFQRHDPEKVGERTAQSGVG